MSTKSMETFIDVIASNHVIADADFLSDEVDLKGYRGVIFAVNITALNSANTLTLGVHEATTTGGSYAVALQPDGTTSAVTTANVIDTVGMHYVRVLAENVDRFVKLDFAFSATGMDIQVAAIRFGPKSETAPGKVEGTVGDYQILLPV